MVAGASIDLLRWFAEAEGLDKSQERELWKLATIADDEIQRHRTEMAERERNK